MDLPPMDIASRAERLVAAFGAVEPAIDGLLVTHLTNIRYLTGFTGSAALLLVTPDGLVFVTDGRYRDQAADQLRGARVDARVEVSNQEQQQLMTAAATDLGVSRLGLEAEHVSWAQHGTFAEQWFPALELVATRGLVEDLREVKDDGEVARIEAACAIADDALANVRPLLLERISERDFGLALDAEMRRLGASAPSFETIVASGPNAAMPHARPSDRTIADGDLVVIDFGARFDGYCSDMTRTVVVGDPDPAQQRLLDVVAEAQQAGVDAVAPGLAAVDLDKACRDVIAAHGLGEAFLHSTGHGVGLDIHERPRVGPRGDATLAAGNVVTVEPGVYLPNDGGVRIEDTVVVTDDGCRPLTRTTKAVAV